MRSGLAARRDIQGQLVRAAKRLRAEVDQLRFAEPITHVYNPLVYAWEPYADYVSRFATAPKRVIFLGMNPGPFGMVQTGIPFGEVAAVRDWLKVRGAVGKPAVEHPRRPITGFACTRSEVSGRRLWGFFAERFGTPEKFFKEHFVVNYCPLVFIEKSGRNFTPDKLRAAEKEALFASCDRHLRTVLDALSPDWVVAVGGFAHQRAGQLVAPSGPQVGRILHPSPASPLANRNWAGAALEQLQRLGIWS